MENNHKATEVSTCNEVCRQIVCKSPDCSSLSQWLEIWIPVITSSDKRDAVIITAGTPQYSAQWSNAFTKRVQ